MPLKTLTCNHKLGSIARNHINVHVNKMFYIVVEETLNMTYKRTLLCEPDAILFALMLNKSVKGQNPPHASLAPLSIFCCDVISDVILLWVGGLLELLYYNYNAIYRILLHIMQQIIERAIQLFKKKINIFFHNW